MKKIDLIDELKRAHNVAEKYEGGNSGEFLDAKEFASALNEAIQNFESSDDSCVKNLWLWFAPTSVWDDLIDIDETELGNSCFEKLEQYIKEYEVKI